MNNAEEIENAKAEIDEQEIGRITLDTEAEEVLRQWLETKVVENRSEQDQHLWRICIEIRAAYPGSGSVTKTEALAFINTNQRTVFENASFLEIAELNKTKLIPPIMIALPAGTFIMGTTEIEKAELLAIGIQPFKDEIPHEVTLSGFELASTQVAQESFLSLMGFNPSYFRGDKRPVEQLNWFEAVEYCSRLSYVFSDLEPEQKIMLEAWAETARGGRNSEKYNSAMVEYAKYAQDKKGLFMLPTEAQWEYAAKGGRNYFFRHLGRDNLFGFSRAEYRRHP